MGRAARAWLMIGVQSLLGAGVTPGRLLGCLPGKRPGFHLAGLPGAAHLSYLTCAASRVYPTYIACPACPACTARPACPIPALPVLTWAVWDIQPGLAHTWPGLAWPSRLPCMTEFAGLLAGPAGLVDGGNEVPTALPQGLSTAFAISSTCHNLGAA